MPQQVTRQWWPTPRHGLPPGCSAGDSDNPTPTCVQAAVGPSPPSAPPVPVAGQSPPGNSANYHVLHSLSLLSPSCRSPPFSAPHSSLSHEPTAASTPSTLWTLFPRGLVWWEPTRSPIRGHFFDVAIRPQQRHPRHFWCVTCTCSNCASGTNSMAKNPDESRRKEQHNCPYPNCSKVYGKTSYLLAHIGLHTGELDHPKPCTEQVIALISNQHVIMLG